MLILAEGRLSTLLGHWTRRKADAQLAADRSSWQGPHLRHAVAQTSIDQALLVGSAASTVSSDHRDTGTRREISCSGRAPRRAPCVSYSRR